MIRPLLFHIRVLFKSVCLVAVFAVSLVFLAAFPSSTFAQAPKAVAYQAVIRNSANAAVVNQAVGMQISILQGSATGTAVYVETQTPTAGANGLVSIQIGAGTVVTGSFADINWGGGTYFIKTETDPTGGTNYTITGTSQLLSVPYALYAGKTGDAATADTLKSGVDASSQYSLLHNGTGWVTKSPANANITTRVNSGLSVDGHISIPADKSLRYQTPKTVSLLILATEFRSVNPNLYDGQIDRGYSTPETINGLGGMWAAGGALNNPAYFVAQVNLPDSARITKIEVLHTSAGSASTLSNYIKLYQTNGNIGASTAYNSTEIASIFLYSSIVDQVKLTSTDYNRRFTNSAYYGYFLRWTTEQNNPGNRLCSVRITYQINTPN